MTFLYNVLVYKFNRFLKFTLILFFNLFQNKEALFYKRLNIIIERY